MQSTFYNLVGNTPVTGTGLWTAVGNPPGITFVPQCIKSTATRVNGLIPGNVYQFKWTITANATCPPSSDVVQITVDQSPLGGTTSSDATVCTGTNAGVITLAGQLGAVIRWEYNNSGTWQAIANTTATQNYSGLTQTTQYRAWVQSGVCPAVPSSPTTITVMPLPVAANAGTNDEVCNMTSYPLKGNNPAPGTGLWTAVGNPPGVTFVNATIPTTTVNGLQPGNTYQFKWTITGSAACPSNSSTVQIIDDQPPVAGTTGSNTTVCINGNGGQVTLSSQLGNVVRWEYNDSGYLGNNTTNTTSTQSYLNLTKTTQYRA